jgi:hypothetical protein
MTRHQYHASLSEKSLRGLQEMIGMEIIQFQAFCGTSYSCNIRGDAILDIHFNADVHMTFKNDNGEYFEWTIINQSFGDTWVGFDMYGLDIELKQHKASIKDWLESIKGSPESNMLRFSTTETLKNIDIYGINEKFNRLDEGRSVAHVDANLDSLIVLNTTDNNKLVITGNGRNSSRDILITRYPKRETYEFEEWVENRENQWNERIFNFKRRIE